MTGKRDIEARIRSIIHSGADTEIIERELSRLIEIRVDEEGRIFFVRKGAPRSSRHISPIDKVEVKDIYDWKRSIKRKRFLDLKNDPKYIGPIILAEGDSWFEYPFNRDLLDWVGTTYAVLSLARAGDKWSDIIDEDADPAKLYSDGTPMGLFHTLNLADIRPPQVVMLSVGGNDLVGQIVRCTYPFDPARPEDQYINHAEFDPLLELVLDDYRAATSKLVSMGKEVILHTYDYPNPTEDGQYIGHRLTHERNIPGVGLMRRIVNEMIDAFYCGLAGIEGTSKEIHLVDLRRTIGTDDYLNGPDPALWADEMHGTREGYKRLWLKMKTEIERIYP